jgi:hypothetical protein
MRESYDIKVRRLMREGKISKEYAKELISKHREELEKRRMFSQGEPITTMEDLLKETWVIVYGRTWHIKAILNWQTKIILNNLEKGHIYKAVRKEKRNENDTMRND